MLSKETFTWKVTVITEIYLEYMMTRIQLIVEEIKAELYSEEMKKTRECKCYQTIIESIDDIDITIVEVELNTPINKPIGGYAE